MSNTKWIGGGLLGAAVVVGVASWGLLSYRLQRLASEEQAILEGLERDGFSLDPSVLHPQPSGENGAPEFEALVAELEPLDDAFHAVRALSKRFTRPVKFAAEHSEAQRAELVAGAERFSSVPADFEARLDVALAKPWTFPPDYTLPYLRGVMDLGALALVRVGTHLDRGDSQATWDAIERALRFTATLPQDYNTPYLVRGELFRGVVEAMSAALGQGLMPTPERVERLRAAFKGFVDPAGVTRALRGDLTWVLDLLPQDAEGLQRYRAEVDPKAPGLQTLVPARARVVRLMDRAIRASTLPPLEALAALRAIDAEKQPADDQRREDVVGVLVSPGTDLYETHLAQVARVHLIEAAFSLAAQGGELPETLELPADPFAADAPLRWRRDAPRRGVLWSVGPDGEDDQAARPDVGAQPDPALDDLIVDVRLPE
ncbi:MAG: hypothetical protein R3F62_09450 [Planctomycetota bacterium]